MSTMFQLANTCMSFMTSSPLMSSGSGDSGYQGSTDLPDVNNTSGQWGWVSEVVDAINQLLYPILILVGTAGVIYAIYLGVNLARADSADKQQEAKKRMLNAIIGLVSIIALILLLKLFLTYLPQWVPELQVGTPKA